MKKFLIILFAFASIKISAQQIENVVIDNSGDPDEPSIMINPKNINELVAGANIDQQYYSHDGGHTWTENILTSTFGVWGDPVIGVDTTGKFLYVHLSDPSHQNWGSPNFLDRIVCQPSTDAGVTFQNGSFLGKDSTKIQDKAWIAIDPVTNYYYVTWTQFDAYGTTNSSDSSVILFSRSTDGGTTWSAAKRINRIAGDCVDSDGTAEGAVPCVGPNGEVYVVWSTNDVLYFDRSTDYGNTWLDADKIVASQIGGWDYPMAGMYRANGLPVSACDISGGPYNGTIYANWSDNRNGDHDVFVSKSTDGGNTWNNPVRVNDDASGKEQFMSWMTVDQSTGNVYVVWNDRRNYTNNNTDIYLAYSTDGGNTFTNMQINTNSFDPGVMAFMGDYINVAAAHNKVAAIWCSKFNGNKQIEVALINFSTAVDEVKTTTRNFSLIKVAPNPASDSFNVNFQIQTAGNYSMYIQDIGGKKKTEVFENKMLQPGKESETIDASELKLHRGNYLITLTDGKQFDVLKLVMD